MKLLIVLAVFVIVTVGAKVHPKETQNLKIIDGGDAVRDQFPFQVLVRNVKKFTDSNGGSIIGQRWVATAAHWVSNYKPLEVEVVAGILKRSDTGIDNEQVLDVVEIITHPDYDKVTNFYDICLLRLSSLLIYGDNVKNISLPPANYVSDDLATISGWGYIDTTQQTLADTLQFAYVRILDQYECESAMRTAGRNVTWYNPTINLCSATRLDNGDQSACTSDGGGPLVADNYLVGIMSWYTDCVKPNIHTKVSAVRQWILDNTKGEV